MGGMRKLINQPIKVLSLYAALLFAVSWPICFYLIDSIWLDELDERNEIVLERVESKLRSSNKEWLSISLWVKQLKTVQPGIVIHKTKHFHNQKKHFFSETRDELIGEEWEEERYRCLETQLVVNQNIYFVHLEQSIEETEDTLQALGLLFGAFFVVLVIGFIYLNQRISKKLWSPFYDSLEKMDDFQLTSGQVPQFKYTNLKEFAQLNGQLTSLMKRSQKQYQQQKVFIENTSHELQTPLSIVQSKLEILQQNKGITSEQSKSIEQIENALKKVNHINKNLLFLAKIENQQFNLSTEVDIKPVLLQMIEQIEAIAVRKKLSIKLEIQKKTVVSDSSLMESIISNLLSNALRHTPEDGEISIELNERQLIIKNTGEQALPTDQLFQRFNANSKTSGLGLAIVAEIVQQHGWALTYSFENDYHQFIISF
jgi:signal transduction histidine kinase